MATLTSSRVKKMSPQLLVSDIERSVAFYTKKLGFGLDFIYEDFYAGIIRDGFTIHLKSAEGLERREVLVPGPLGGPRQLMDSDSVLARTARNRSAVIQGEARNHTPWART